jgi:hypothetical protein
MFRRREGDTSTAISRGLDYLYRYGRPGCLLCGTQEFSVGPEHYREEAPEGMKMVMIVCSYCGFAMTVNAEKMPRRGT